MFKKRYTAPQMLGVFFLSLGVFSGGTYYLMKTGSETREPFSRSSGPCT